MQTSATHTTHDKFIVVLSNAGRFIAAPLSWEPCFDCEPVLCHKDREVAEAEADWLNSVMNVNRLGEVCSPVTARMYVFEGQDS
jgi:demethoxyubiquinone hydroxylase (CLK1/Coq7/Cat5 family)